MNVKEIIGNIIGYIPPQIHNFKLKELQDSLQSLIDCRERQVVDLQNQMAVLKTQRNDADELRQTIQSLTAKIQAMKLEASLRAKVTEKESDVASAKMACDLISFISYIELLKANSDLSLEAGLNLLKSKYEDIIALCGIRTISECEGPFNASCQKVVSTKTTEDVAKYGCIAEIVKPGYFIGENCIQPIEVIVYSKQ